MNESWIREAVDLLHDLQSRRDKLLARRDDIDRQLAEVDKRIAGGEAFLESYKEKYGIAPSFLSEVASGDFEGKTYPEILTEIATKNGGYLKVSDAVDIILKAGFGSDKRTVQANVYGSLKRLRARFTKVSPGLYRYVGRTPDHPQDATSELFRQQGQGTRSDDGRSEGSVQDQQSPTELAPEDVPFDDDDIPFDQ